MQIDPLHTLPERCKSRTKSSGGAVLANRGRIHNRYLRAVERFLLQLIEVPRADVHYPVFRDGSKARYRTGEGAPAAPHNHGERHTVQKPALSDLRRVEIPVRVEPDDAQRGRAAPGCGAYGSAAVP